MDHVYLQGSEDVSRAASTMREAAATMERAAESFSYTMQTHQRFLDEWLDRLASVMTPPVSEPAKPAPEPRTIGPGDVWMSDAFLLAVAKPASEPVAVCGQCEGSNRVSCSDCSKLYEPCVAPTDCPPCPACGGKGVK